MSDKKAKPAKKAAAPRKQAASSTPDDDKVVLPPGWRDQLQPPRPEMPARVAPTTATSASAWRSIRLEGQLVPLPSGNVARLRRTLDLFTLIKENRLPNPLAGFVSKLIGGGLEKLQEGSTEDEVLEAAQASGEKISSGEVDDAVMGQLLVLIDMCLPDIFIEPRVMSVPEGENPATWVPDDPEAIALPDVDLSDRMAAFAWAQGGILQLKSFPDAGASVAAPPHGDDVPLPPKRPASAG